MSYVPTTQDIRKHMPLVQKAVASFRRKLPPNVLSDDLTAAGTYGLLDALRKHGGDASETFEWYARIRIRGAIIDELRAQDWMTRGGRKSLEDVSCVCISDDGDDFEEDAPGPLGSLTAKGESEDLALAISRLRERERHIVFAHYYEGVPFNKIAETFGVSEARVSQLHSKALKELRELLPKAG